MTSSSGPTLSLCLPDPSEECRLAPSISEVNTVYFPRERRSLRLMGFELSPRRECLNKMRGRLMFVRRAIECRGVEFDLTWEDVEVDEDWDDPLRERGESLPHSSSVSVFEPSFYLYGDTMNGTAATVNGGAGPMHQYGGPSKKKRAILAEEDATKLQFGEFADGEPLTPMDVASLLEAVRNAPNAPAAPDNKVYKAASEYLKEFSNASMDVVDSMRTALMSRPGFLNKFEVAQIIYLRPSSLIEAVTLIPSLERYHGGDEDQATLEQLLDDVRMMARYNNRV